MRSTIRDVLWLTVVVMGLTFLASWAVAFLLRELAGFDRRFVGIVVVITAPAIMAAMWRVTNRLLRTTLNLFRFSVRDVLWLT